MGLLGRCRFELKMSSNKSYTAAETEEFLAKVFEILDSFDEDRFLEVFSKDLEHNSGLQKDVGLDAFINNFKAQMKMMPGFKMRHVSERTDIAIDGLVYSSGHTTMTFDADPTSPVTIPVMGVFSRVAEGPEAGKIRIMTIYEDHMPFMQKLQAMAGLGN